MFETLIVQPLYNLLVAIYGLLPGHDLGLSLILFTVLIRLALWPLLKKQLHQSKVMRDLQPELKKIKKSANGDRQKEATLMMELYKEKGISPFGSIGLTLVQLPLFIGVFQAARALTEQFDRINDLTYSFVANIPHIADVIGNNNDFSYTSAGFIDLSKRAFDSGTIYIPVVALGLLATVLAYIQSKQILPQQKDKKKLRDILKASSQGKQPAQEDMTAAMGGTMLYLMPALTLMFVIASPGAMIVYLLASSAIGIYQQSLIFKKDTDEMEDVAEVVSVKKQPVSQAEKKVEKADRVSEKVSKKGKVTTKTRIIAPSETPKQSKKNAGKKKKRKKR